MPEALLVEFLCQRAIASEADLEVAQDRAAELAVQVARPSPVEPEALVAMARWPALMCRSWG